MITIDDYSTQLAAARSPDHTPNKPNENMGRVRIQYFQFNTDDISGLAEDDVIGLCELPKGARFIKGRIMFEAMGANQTADIGLKAKDDSGYLDEAATVADDPDFFTTTPISVAAAGESDFGYLQEDNPGYETEKECVVVLTTANSSGSNAWAADKEFSGYVLYVVD